MKIKTVVSGLILSCSVFAALAATSSLESLRGQFQSWQKNYQSLSEAEQNAQLDLLKKYPLYPYAKYQFYMAHLDTITSDEINQFVSQNADFPLNSTLIQTYLENLTKQKKWQEILKTNVNNSIASTCYYRYALLQIGEKERALNPIKRIWLSGKDITSACDPIFEEWGKTAEKTPNLILLRIELALNENNRRLAKYLIDQLPDNYKTLKKNLTIAIDNPKQLEDFAKNIFPSPFSKKMVMSLFSRLANSDSEKAKKLLPKLVKQYNLNKEQEQILLRSIASNYFSANVTLDNAKWRDTFIAGDRQGSLIERRIRLALKNGDIKQVEYWIDLLPKSEINNDEWKYWKAVSLEQKSQQDQANKIFELLAEGRGFYAMYSAQKLNQPFDFYLDYFKTDKDSIAKERQMLQQKYQSLPLIQRIAELRELNMLKEASMEWRNYLYYLVKHDQEDYAQLARYAYHQGWGEHSVQATIAGRLWDNWIERFPIIYQTYYDQSLNDKAIPLSFALAITRQESALEASVQSPAGARGLMQLMPGTARDSAKKLSLTDYTSTDQLYDPEINIKLGTYYLDYTYQLFDNNRILAAAAYNAGPNRVNQWLSDSQGKLDAITFIESIPFTETRNYVKSVLVYDYIYQRVLGGKPTTILTTDELARKY